MRTTVTISEELLQRALKVSGKKFLSQAIVSSLEDYFSLKGRLSFLEKLYSHKIPHSFKEIKRQRKKRRWCL